MSQDETIADGRRKATLDRYEILDTLDEGTFDAVTGIVARTLGVPIALVSFVDSKPRWRTSCRGLDAALPRELTFCSHAILADELFVVRDATLDPRFAADPLVTGEPHVRSFAGAPLIAPDGARIGTLCALDRRPREHTPDEVATLRDLATIVVELLERRLAQREQQILARVAEVSPNAAFVYDLEQRRAVWGRQALARFFGVEAARWGELAHPDDRRRLEQFVFGPDDTVEIVPFRILARDGHPERALVARRTVFERDEGGEVRSIVGIVMDVTELRLLDERLRASEHALADRVLVLEGILESADEGVLFADAEGRLQLANTRARELRNTPDDLPDERLIQHAGIYDEDGATPLPPDRLPLVRALRGEHVEVRLVLRNPRFPQGVHIQARARPIHDAHGTLRGAVAILADVTALQLARERSARELTNLTAIIDALPIGLFVRRGEQTIYANPALAQLLDRDLSELVSAPTSLLIEEADRELVARRMANLDAGGRNTPIELRLCGADGPVSVEANGIRIDYDGHDAILVFCRDVRVEKRARAQMDASLREKEALLKEIHHRVKNNLSVFASILFIQSRASRDPVVRSALEASIARVRSIGLVHDQLYRSHDFGRVDLEAYLRTLAHETTSTLDCEARGIEISLHAEPVTIDLTQAMPCGLIVNELLTNAVKHAFPHGGGTIRVDVTQDDGRVHLQVADDGVGFDAAARPSTTLGLDLVTELCQQLHAVVRQDSTHGTSFAFSFARKV
jgi:two-component sensor histidine kinase